MNTQESNKIIAQFDGIIEYNSSLGCDTLVLNADTQYREIYRLPELQYHNSWGWLMPVVEKIESIPGVCFDIYREASIVKYQPEDFKEWGVTEYDQNKKINHIYRAVINFIQWHNTHNKK